MELSKRDQSAEKTTSKIENGSPLNGRAIEALNDLEELQISNENLSPLHYLSWLSGIIVTCFYLSAITIVPLHNSLCEPQYYWEFMLFAAIGWVSCWNAGMFISTRFWANLHPGPWMTSFIMIMIITTAFNVVLTISYYYLWTDLLGFYAPMPLSYYLPGTCSGLLSFFLAWFRYTLFWNKIFAKILILQKFKRNLKDWKTNYYHEVCIYFSKIDRRTKKL